MTFLPGFPPVSGAPKDTAAAPRGAPPYISSRTQAGECMSSRPLVRMTQLSSVLLGFLGQTVTVDGVSAGPTSKASRHVRKDNFFTLCFTLSVGAKPENTILVPFYRPGN